MIGVTVFVSTQFDFKTLDDKKWTLNELEGKWLIVNHFAEWCAPCLEEIPELNALDIDISDKNIELFAVSYDEMPKQSLIDIKQKYNIQFKLVEQQYAINLPGLKPKQLPATYLISPDGKHVETVLGKQTAVSLLKVVSKAAGQ
jgi:thiol-disulfide isomerase/thioredoxin